MADVVCLGELLVDFVPTVTGTGLIDAPSFKKAAGGAPANVAVGLARLGTSSAFLGKVGDDAFGTFLVRTLADAGVDVRSVRTSATARTALAFVSLRADGEREFLFYRHPSADMLFEPGEVDAGAIRAARALHFGSISLVSEPSRSATLRASELARESGCLVSYDPNMRLALWPDARSARAGILRGLAEAEVVKISEEELEFLAGARDLGAARRELWHDRLKLLVVTRGPAGCTFLTRDAMGDVPGFAVEAIDTTGAGDGFVAGLLHSLLGAPRALEDESTLRAACRLANAVGALTTTGRGAIPSLPYRRRVDELLASGAD